MKEGDLFTLKRRLFDQGLISKLSPDNIWEDKEGEISVFSDYYGALLGVEVFLKNKKEYGSCFPISFEEEYRLVLEQLTKNLSVSNYKTTFGRGLNDRIRGLLLQEEDLPEVKVKPVKRKRFNSKKLRRIAGVGLELDLEQV